MKRSVVALLVLGLALAPAPASAQSWLDRAKDAVGGALEGGDGGNALGEERIVDGLKEALRVATGRAVEEVGHAGGYLDDPQIRIPLPKSLRTAQTALQGVGMGGLADDLQVRLNRAAEAAAPKAQAVFLDAVQQMTLDDARRILDGPKDAATRYFERTMTPALKDEMRPVVRDSLKEARALAAYDRMLGRYSEIPFVPDVTANLTDYTLEQGLDGLFHYLAREEAAIRSDPAARTTELLKEVFGG